MSSEWQKLADLWYRKREIYAAQWSDEPDRLHLSVVAGAPFGGPVATVRDEHVFQQVRGNLKPELQTWTSAGRLIASTPWVYTGLLTMGWSAQETLVCIFETGVIRVFSVLCQQINCFTVDERIKTEGGAVQAALWPHGVALVSRRLSLFINTSMEKSGDCCHKCADMRLSSAPLCICVLPPAHEGSAEIQVIVGTEEGPVLVADRHSCRDLGLDEGPYMAFAVSSSGRLLAGLSTRGVFKVLSVSDDLRVLDVAKADCRKKPRQMVWCGDDCIALYLAVPTPSNSIQHVLFVGGPQNDWIPYQYDAPLHLVPESDGCRILGTHKVEFVQRVPHSTEAIYSIGNCDPPAMLCYALERFEKGDVCAQESLRLIKDELDDAVETCRDAALHEHDPETVESLLSAAVFGRHFLTEQGDPAEFIKTCRNLRICIELRKATASGPPLDIPITVPQLERLGFAGLALRLAQRHHHLLAARICEWVGHQRDYVYFHWACEKIRAARGSPLTDEQLCGSILEKFRACPGIGYAEVAKVAAEMYRPHLATMLLNYEPCSHAQVQVLLQLSREGDDDNQHLMLRLAMKKAAQSCDPDLLYGSISAACGGDPCGRAADMQSLVQLIKEDPHDLQAVGDVFSAMLQRNERFDRARGFQEQLGRVRQAAYTALLDVFRKREADERMKWLRFVRDLLGQSDAGASELERTSMQFVVQASTEEADLLKAQIGLEEQAVMKRWPNGPHRFVGLPLITTLRKLIELRETGEADNLKTAMKLSDKRYWRIKVQALADGKNWMELQAMATQRTLPAGLGYEVYVDAYLRHGEKDRALPFVQKVKNPDLQASFYSRMGMEEEAAAARARSQERAGPARLLQNMLRLS